jgi:hypothetical protein
MLAALVLLLGFALLVGWEVLCLGQVVLADRVRSLPWWVWAVACLIFIPLGGILFLLLGRVWGSFGTPAPRSNCETACHARRLTIEATVQL